MEYFFDFLRSPFYGISPIEHDDFLCDRGGGSLSSFMGGSSLSVDDSGLSSMGVIFFQIL